MSTPLYRIAFLLVTLGLAYFGISQIGGYGVLVPSMLK